MSNLTLLHITVMYFVLSELMFCFLRRLTFTLQMELHMSTIFCSSFCFVDLVDFSSLLELKLKRLLFFPSDL
jgi:hypothetical protein